MQPKIILYHNKDCHVWQTLPKVIEEAMAEVGLSPSYEIKLVSSHKEANEKKFFGSPQITINGEDIDERAKELSNYQVEGCRFYLWQGKSWDFPPKEMIVEMLKKHLANSK